MGVDSSGRPVKLSRLPGEAWRTTSVLLYWQQPGRAGRCARASCGAAHIGVPRPGGAAENIESTVNPGGRAPRPICHQTFGRRRRGPTAACRPTVCGRGRKHRECRESRWPRPQANLSAEVRPTATRAINRLVGRTSSYLARPEDTTPDHGARRLPRLLPALSQAATAAWEWTRAEPAFVRCTDDPGCGWFRSANPARLMPRVGQSVVHHGQELGSTRPVVRATRRDWHDSGPPLRLVRGRLLRALGPATAAGARGARCRPACTTRRAPPTRTRFPQWRA